MPWVLFDRGEPHVGKIGYLQGSPRLA